MSQPKYLLLPGYVTSKNDGQRHFISGSALARLYNVDPRDCVLDMGRGELSWYKDLKVLEPRYDGNYTL